MGQIAADSINKVIIDNYVCFMQSSYLLNRFGESLVKISLFQMAISKTHARIWLKITFLGCIIAPCSLAY